ncbi:MspI family type II restriction endonuclease [Streptococcus suis]|uniref:MspI family type II restriction endonuclease n=1 Tax=Streptococcus suis TaxID=1307 RepID=UPI0037573F04
MSFNIDNQQKSLSGKASNLTLDELLQSISKIPKLNISVTKNYTTGYENCEKQFKMDYQVCFHDFDDELWLIKPTSSIRSDRIYGNEFFAQNIKIIDKRVSKIFVVIPDSVTAKEIQNKDSYSNKIHSKEYTSFLDDILTFSELRNLILEHASELLSQGISANILGNNAEEMIVNLLTDKKNILLWNDYERNHKTIKSTTYKWFIEILLNAGFTKNKYRIDNIIASKEIPKLSNNGYPKTDVMFTVITNGKEVSRTISIKNTTASTVSIHEGDIEDVIVALKLRKDSPLSQALRKFQEYGSLKVLSENDATAYSVLEQQLSSYNQELAGLFLFGVNSPLVNNPIQIADLILYTNNFGVFSRDNYIYSYLNEYSSRGQLGTPFKWTYPSKKRGQKIQIKGFTNNKK